MNKIVSKRLVSVILCMAMLVTGCIPAFAAWDGYVEPVSKDGTKLLVDLSNIATIMNVGAVPSTKTVNGERYSANWFNHPSTKTIRFTNVVRDWSDCNTISFDIYSEKATNANIVFMIYTDYVPTPGKTISYLRYDLKLNFEGWKHFEAETTEFTNGNYADWAKVNYVDFIANGWGCTPHEESNIHISSIYGTLGEQEVSQAQMISMDVSAEDKKKVFSTLNGSTAVMNFADNMVKDGELQTLNIEDKITTWDGVSVAPVSFLENVMGVTSAVSGDEVTLTLGTKSIKLKNGSSEYRSGDLGATVRVSEGVFYIPLAAALTALGQPAKEIEGLVIIGTDAAAEAVEKSKPVTTNLKTMLCAKKFTKDNITKADWKQLKDNWRKYLTGDENKDLSDPEIAAKLKSLETGCEGVRKTMNKETEILALFGNIPVETTSNMTTQYTQLYKMAEAYGTYGTKYYKDPEVKKDILFSLDWLYENLYGEDEINGTGWRDTSGYNWWDWYCGVGKALCDTLMIMESDLTPAKIKQYLSLYDHLRTKMRTNMTPDNAASRVYTGTAAAALQEDLDRMNTMVNDYNLLLIPVEEGNGTQEDGLYKTHKYFAYSTAYGTSSLLDRLTKVQSILGGTAFDFATPYKYASCTWMYETFGPIMYNGYMTNAQSGRSKGDEAGYSRYAIGAMLDFIGVFGLDDDIRLKQFIQRNVTADNEKTIKNGLEIDQFVKLREVMQDTTIPDEPYYRNKIYYTGDMVAHQRDDYGFALSMSSTRIAPWESINGVNLSGWYQSDGMLYTYIDTDPTAYNASYWRHGNPYHMPGTTVDTQERIATSIRDTSEVLSKQDFAGAAGFDELYATAAMQLESYHNDNQNAVLSTEEHGGDAPYHESTLMAKKAWFMFDDEVVALGSDIDANDGFEVQTIIENRKLVKTEKITSGGESSFEPYNIVSVKSSGDDGNVVENTIDDSYDTRWSAEGEAHAIYELESAVPIGYVGIAQYGGINGKQAIFELETSTDGENWTQVWGGKASGTTASMEAYDMKGTVAKYIKYNGHGRTNSMWNSVTELKIFPPRADGSMPVDSSVETSNILGTEKITVDGTVLEKKSTYKKSFDNPSWMHIEGIAGYWLPNGGKLEMDKVVNTSSFLEVWLSHGVSPQNGTYSYVVLPKKTAEETAAYAGSPDVEIISNTEKLQAVKENKLGLTGMVFWEAGSLNDITVTMPCIVMTGNSGDCYQVTVADPTQLLENGTLTIDGEWKALEADERCKVVSEGGKTTITVDFEGSKGRTLPIKLRK